LDEDLRPEFDMWLEGNASFMSEKTTLHPGGRAVVEGAFQVTRKPSQRIPVELWWQRGEDGMPYISALRLEAPPGHVFNPVVEGEWLIDVGSMWAGLVLKLAEKEKVSDDMPPRPSAGRPPTIPHYQRILAEYEQLKREGHAAPINVLVQRYGAKKGTVKSWLHRARKYLPEKESDS
jgi:hypothetical protein